MAMRISTSTMYELGVSRIGDLQSSMIRTQQQIATGRKMLTPADDPIGSARALEVAQSKSINEQYAVNRQNARNTLSQEEQTLQSVTSLIQDAQELAVTAGNGAYDDTQRKYLAAELQVRFDDLMNLANSRDAAGNFMFAGFQVASQPFLQTAGGAQYTGDQGQRMLQIGTSRQIPLSNAGNEIFERVRTGNGTFAVSAGAGNTGTGIVSAGSVTAPPYNGHDYTVTFTVSGGVTTYDIVDTTLGAPVAPAARPYKSGEAITFDGLQFDVKGNPANGDQFNLVPSADTSIFTTLRNLINVLNAPTTTPAGQTSLGNGLIRAGSELASMLDNVLTVRASLGARLKEIDTLDSAGSARDLQYAQELSDLQDLDYNKALSDLSKQQITLEAAQKSFVTISGLSLFKLI